jgi:hypothetical protein
MNGDDQKPEGRFQKIYALVFLIILLAGIGGGLCVWGGQWAIATMDSRYYALRNGSNIFQIFLIPGLRDWRVQFGIGATIGAVCAVRFNIKRWRDKD